MPTSFDKILSSRTFQFLLGPDSPDRKTFTIHTAVVEDHSAPLSALMNGFMREATDGIGTLEDIDEQTFVRFCEYAYMGDYTPTQQQIVLSAPKVEKAEPVVPVIDDDESWTGWGINSKKDRKKVKSDYEEPEKSRECSNELQVSTAFWDGFKRRNYSVTVSKTRQRELDDGPFLNHARVYVFADRYDIAGLRVLALDKLHQALCAFKVAGVQMREIIDLAKFTYSNDNTRDSSIGEKIDSLRSMVVHFIVCVLETIVKDNSFLELMEQGGNFSRDLISFLGKRIKGGNS